MRLTNDMRSDIVSNAVKKAGFTERKAKHDKKMAEWAEACRIYALGGLEVAKKLAAFEKRFKKSTEHYPKSVVSAPFRKDFKISMNIARKRFSAQFHGTGNSQDLVYKTTPWGVTLNASHELAEAFDKLEAERRRMDEEEADLRQKVRATVNSYTTAEKLLKVWPEVKELLPSHQKPVPKLPAIPVAELNAQIGLPTE